MTYADESAARAALTNGTAIPADLRQIVVTYPNLRPAVAAYPGTDEAMLGWLRDLHDPGVDAQLAARSRPAEAAPAAPQPGATRPLPPSGPISPAPGAPQLHPAGASGPLAAPAPTQIIPAGPAVPGGPAGPVAAAGPGQPAAPIGPTNPTGTSMQAPAGGPPGSLTQAYPATAPFTPAPPMHPGPVPAAATPPPNPDGRGSGAKIALIVVAAILLIGGGVWAAFATGLVPGFGPSPGQTPTAAPPSPGGEQPGGEQPGTDPPDPPTPIEPPPSGFACWDGSEADALAACPTPRSSEEAWQYLRYVYPSLPQHSSCRQADSTGKSDYQGVTVYWDCELGDSLLRYRYWVDPDDAERHYGRKFKNTTAETYDVAIDGQALEGWVKTSEEAIAKQSDGSKRYVATMWLPELQLSLSAEGNDTGAMWNAFNLARIRPLDQVNGHQLGMDPSAVPISIAER